ncbi:MAG: hypothetical protein IKM29_02075 [Clostridia bacterium]|nr:hypothetical protein [Clostridia bacterium]
MSENNMQYEVVSEVPAETAAPVKKSARVMGIIGMVLGILSLCSFYGGNIIFPIVGLILSSIAKKGGEVKFSKVGKITSVIALILAIVACVVAVCVGVIIGIAGSLENLF